jgi:type I restriction-modification system DNA methylase subunit
MNESSHITTSGGLLTQAFIDSIRESSTDRPHTEPAAFGVPWESAPATDKKLEDDVAGAWELLKERWDSIHQEVETLDELDVSTTRQRWLLPLLQLLDFDPQYQRKDLTPTGDEDLRFDVSHRGWNGAAGNGATDDGPALHLLAPSQNLDQRQDSGRGPKAKSPHDMLQVFLNVSEPDLWAVLSNGRFLRLLRDYHHTFSKGYVQFDLESIFEGRNYADFRALYRLCHASRFRPTSDEEEAEIPLEDFHQTARATGVKIGEDLRPQVRDAIEHLGNGFLQGEPDLIQELQGDPDAARDFYSEILRVVYRILFLLFAEQRGLVPDADAPRSELYWSDYSLTALREEAEGGVPERDDYTDLWHGLQTTFRMVRDGADELGVFGYNGELFDLSGEDYLDGRACDNARLLRAVRALTLIEREGVLQRISYLDLGVEELGSIYEALLDYTPRVTEKPEEIEGTQIRAHTFVLDPRGLERKQSGSYYTPDSLVNELVKSALLPVMRDRLQDAGLPVVEEDDLGEVTTGLLQEYAELTGEQREAGAEALLSMTVCDPAAGSGHFLVKANDVLGAEVARLRSGDEYPTEHRIREAKREVLARCIYAVDLNPMAVELCKVSLWINASVDNRPLNFLDHHIKCGNSLIGATPELLEDGVPYEAFALGRSGDDRELAKAFRKQNRDERKESKEGQGVQMGAFRSAVTTEPRIEYRAGDFSRVAQEDPAKAREVYAEYQADPERKKAKLEADTYTAAFFWPMPEGTDWAPTYGELFRLQRQGPSAIPDPQQARIEAMAKDHNFFHWHLEFPDVFGDDGDGGFDVVLGNPPWERIKLQEKEFFAVKAPEIAGAQTASKRKDMIENLEETGDSLYEEYEQAQHFSEAFSTYLRESGRYDLTAVGDVNTYQIFAGLARQVVGSTGRVGVIVPSGIATDYYTQDYFNTIVENRELVSLYDFENRKQLFLGVDGRMKFCLLTLTGQGAPERKIDFAFFLTQPEQLSGEERHFTLTKEELFSMNPNTGTCPTFRSKRDAEITKSIYDAAPVLINEAESRNPWGASFLRMFDMSNDSDLFCTLESLEIEGCSQQGNQFVCGDDTYLPLYEGRMIHHYDHRTASVGVQAETTFRSGVTIDTADEEHRMSDFTPMPRSWIRKSKVESRVPASYDRDWFLGFKDVTSPTNERTFICSFIPKTAVGNKVPLLLSERSSPKLAAMTANLSTLVFDYAVRQKIGGVSLNFYIAKQLPIHPPERYTPKLLEYIVPRVLELSYTAWDLATFADDVWSESGDRLRSALEAQWQDNIRATDGGHHGQTPPEWVEHSDQADEPFPHPPFMWDEERRAHLRADLNGLFGHLYGLNRYKLACILDTFPIVKRKDEDAYGEYRTKRLVLEAYDELEDTDLILEPDTVEA